MRIRLKVSPQEQRREEQAPPADFLFRKSLIPKHDPFMEYVFPVALYCFCTIVHGHGGKQLWDQYRRRFDDPLTEEAHRDTGRLSLSFIGSVAIHLAGALALIPFFDLVASLQPPHTRFRAPIIQPILVKLPKKITLPTGSGESKDKEQVDGVGKERRPDAGSDSALKLGDRGVETPKPSLKAEKEAKDVGSKQSTIIADLQVASQQAELPPILLWTDKLKPNQAPESMAATAIKTTPPPEINPELLARISPQRSTLDPKLILRATLPQVPPKDADLEKPESVRPEDETRRRTVDLSPSTGTGSQSEEGIRLLTSNQSQSLRDFLQIIPAGQLHSVTEKPGETGGSTYTAGEFIVEGEPQPRRLSGQYGGSGEGTGGFGRGSGDGVGRGSLGGNDAGAQPSIADLLATLNLKEPEQVRTIIHPEDGTFDLVVTQTSLSDVFSGARGVLRGANIETVYIQVGSSKEWILQYCEPLTGPPAPRVPQSSNVIMIEETPPTLAAPYPAITVRPPSPIMPKASYIMLHGFITADGQFDKLEVVGTRFRSLMPMLRPSLNKWRFRPASRSGEPVLVEILLLIPPVAI